MVNIKLDKVDNGWVLSYVKPPSALNSHPEQFVTVHKELEEAVEVIKTEFR